MAEQFEPKFRVAHYPQVPCKPFVVDVKDYDEAEKIKLTLGEYDLFLEANNHRCDYCNATVIEIYDPIESDWVSVESREELAELIEMYRAETQNLVTK